MNRTTLLATPFRRRASQLLRRAADAEDVQQSLLHNILRRAAHTEYGQRYSFSDIVGYRMFRERVPVSNYETLKPLIMRMVDGEKDVLWRGKCRRFAQSSGTTDARSKFIPVTDDSLRECHYAGARDAVALYLNSNRESRLFDGKSFILGGSFASNITPPPGVKIGDLSASLIDAINPVVNLVRIPSKKIALMENWEEKLPALVHASQNANITNISGVPSWFLTVLRGVMQLKGVECIHDVWPNLEVFFHGGISFEPYKAEYAAICNIDKMHFLENYNASEGFFAVQPRLGAKGMMLLPDVGVFFEFQPLDDPEAQPVPLWEVEQGKTYALLISSVNGLWRYEIGDTVKINSVNPYVTITIAGRTKCFINAFGEELMVHNAEAAVAEASRLSGVTVTDYTAAPVYHSGNVRGCHQWAIETRTPVTADQLKVFTEVLDETLRSVNSDYDAKRSGDLFLNHPMVTVVAPGCFDCWLASTGKLGGQRKVPRLANDRKIMEQIIKINNQKNKVHD